MQLITAISSLIKFNLNTNQQFYSSFVNQFAYKKPWKKEEMISSKPSRNKLAQWEYKKQQQPQIDENQQFQIYLLANPSDLKRHFIEQVPYLWCHHKIGRERQFQIYLNELVNNQLQVKGFPYVDNMLQFIDEKQSGNFKIICQAKDLERILQYHSTNKKLMCIHVFDQTLTTPRSLTSLPRNKKIEIKSSQFKQFKRLLYRKNHQKNETQTFMNATRITNWDISQVNQSRLVLKTLLVAKNDSKGKEDFVRLANNVQQQLGKVAEYEMQYKLDSAPQQAIKWYSKQSFYHRLVNNTLKAGKGNPLLLSYIRFPVKQLYTAIKSIYNSRKIHTESFQCYRGGRISEKELQYFRQNIKGFIEMQGFLSCSKNKKEMQEFVVNCVFKITVNNLQRDKEWDHGFCILDNMQLTEYVKQEEVLFNIFAVMEIKGVTRQTINNKEVDAVHLQYGSLATLLYQKKHNLTLKDRQYSQKCINNYLALKPYYDSINNQVDCFRYFGKFKQVEQYYLTLLKYLQKNQPQINSSKYLNVYFSLGQNYLSLQSYSQAKQYFLKARDIAQSLRSSNTSNQDQTLLAKTYNGLGIANKNLNKLIQAKQNYIKTIRLIQRSRNKNGKVYLATAYNNLALILVEQLQQENALEYYQKALNLLQGQQNETIANIHYNLGQYYIAKSSFKQSIKNLIRSLQIYTKIFGTHKQTINCHIRLGEAYLKSGSIECNRHFNLAMDMMKNLPFHSQTEYVQLKREIQELKSNQNKGKRTVSSFDSYQANDIFSFIGKNQQELHRYLSKDKLANGKNVSMQGYQQKYISQKGIGFPLLGKNFYSQANSIDKLPPLIYGDSNNGASISSLETKLFSNQGNMTKSPLVHKQSSVNNYNVNNNMSNNLNNNMSNNLNSLNCNNNSSLVGGFNSIDNLINSQQNNKNVNQSEKLRQLRGKNLLDTQIPTTYQSLNLHNSNHNKSRYNNNPYNNDNNYSNNNGNNYNNNLSSNYSNNLSSNYSNNETNLFPYLNNRKTVTDPSYQDAIDKKIASFNQNDFISNLQLNRQKRNLIFG